ncbi:MAG: 2Fe-2S iron-sulfur cluster binding domain-containing protein [Pirellulales bacterium]|nr:2Fe-2S iron-sulfur cluster binding domain-containing protein [Pirellulales bacterium]
MSKDTIEISFVQPDGTSTRVEAQIGSSLMEAAIEHGVPGIVAECGGACSCATCHVYVGAAYPELVGAKDSFEDEMLTGTAAEREADSRLSCQVRLVPELSGLVVRVPDRQY